MKTVRRSRMAAIPWKRTLPVVLCLLAGLHLVLIGAKLPSAGLSAFAETDYLEIETVNDFSTADLMARNLRVVGLSSLELPGGEVLAGEGLRLVIGEDDSDQTVDQTVGTSIPSFEVGAHSKISVKVDGKEKQLGLALESKELRLRVIPPRGTVVRIDGANCLERACDHVYQGPQPLYLSGGGKATLEMYMDLADGPKMVANRVAVSAIQLWEHERLSNTVERRGAIRSGSLRFLEAPTQAHPLERGAVIDLKPAGLVLRGLEVQGRSIYLHLSGRVEALSVEIGDAETSLMPTLFDWLSRNPRVRLGLGFLTILLGGGLTMIQRLAQNAPSPEESRPGESSTRRTDSDKNIEPPAEETAEEESDIDDGLLQDPS